MTIAIVKDKRPVLDESARARLVELEDTVRRGLAAYVEAAKALAEIRDNKLYRVKYDTFEEYVAGEFGWKRDRAYKMIAAGKVHDDVSHGIHGGPKNERQARTIVKLKDEHKRREAWAKANKMAGIAGGRITGKHVEKAVAEVKGEQAASTDIPERVYKYLYDKLSECPLNHRGSMLVTVRGFLEYGENNWGAHTVEEHLREAMQHLKVAKAATTNTSVMAKVSDVAKRLEWAITEAEKDTAA